MAEYMIVENNVIKGVYCGVSESGAINLPENHQVREGDTLDFYHSDFTRKSDVELIQENLMQMPAGYKIENNNIVEMTSDEKILAGLEPLPNNMKIENGKILSKTESELFQELTIEEKEKYIRGKRDNLINSAEGIALYSSSSPVLGKMMIVHDSFANMMIPILAPYYKESLCVIYYKFTQDMISRENPDVFIYETTERYLPELLKYNFTEGKL